MNLRKISLDDAELLHSELGCDPEMMKYTDWNPYSTVEAARGFLAGNSEAGDAWSWIVEDDGLAVGTVGAYDYSEEERSIEIGYSIFRSHWGRGYASEAVSLACNVLAADGNIKRIKAWCAVENEASAKVLRKNGFVETEIREATINVNGETYDQIVFEKRFD